MKLSKEMKVWMEQQRNRIESCRISIRSYTHSLRFNQERIKCLLLLNSNLLKAASLEKKQIGCIQDETHQALKEWKEVKKK